MRRSGRCRRHEPGLTALAARREPVPERDALFDHLDRCDRCRADLQDMTLAVVALRRFGDVPEGVAVSPMAWPRMRERIERSRASAAAMAWRWRTTLAGLVAGTLIVAAVVGPFGDRLTSGATIAEPVGYSQQELDLLYRRIERQFITGAQVGTFPALSTTSGSQVVVPTRYPDGIAPSGKEVKSRPTGRPLGVD